MNIENAELADLQMFSNRIEEIMQGTDYTYIEAIVEYCNQTGLEVEVAATLINPHMKSMIQEEATKLKMIKTSESRLPL